MSRPDPALTHLDEAGHARMVEVSHKQPSLRRAVARCEVRMQAETLALIAAGGIPKGDVLAAARIAGIMAAKRTADLIPLCHPLPLGSVAVEIRPDDNADRLSVAATVTTHARTGVEMEALTAASVAALTIYDMCKAVDRAIVVDGLRVIEKSGGTSDHATQDDRA